MGLSHNTLIIVATMLVFCMWGGHVTSRTLNDQENMIQRHEQWMARYGRVYKDDLEKETRFKVFKNNVAYIEAFNNAGNHAYKLSVNEFADQTNHEFKAIRNGFKFPSTPRSGQTTPFRYENVTTVPSSIDWRKKGAVTPIKDQGQCGSCWAFSTIAATEGITGITTGKLISLSEQELMDCDRSGEDQGCEGGYMDDGFEFIVKNKGINTEAAYPYKAVDATCNTKKEGVAAAKITGHEDVPVNSESALLKAVAMQPVSVAIDAGESDFQFYSSGVFNGSCGTELDHGVTAVGYGTSDEGIKYWLVKNSWGTVWGEEGYIRMQRDVEAKEGLCGIAMMASYPTA
ncbi:senescence-specific cysteine protease SAG39-like [Bidens hawaiensis]|uniref:senescence-specific cysteine protease SAG39-like n=1 Tax=Bidens hawaiensis TaxID=980011 RepID=UPI00404A71CA